MKRREIIGVLGAAAAAAVAPVTAAESTQVSRFRLGICSYSFREFQRSLAISMISQLGGPSVSVKDVHLPFTSTPAEIEKAKNDFRKAGLTIVSGGNIDLQDENPAVLRRRFEYARACGMPLIVAAPTHKTLPAVEKLAGEF